MLWSLFLHYFSQWSFYWPLSFFRGVMQIFSVLFQFQCSCCQSEHCWTLGQVICSFHMFPSLLFHKRVLAVPQPSLSVNRTFCFFSSWGGPELFSSLLLFQCQPWHFLYSRHWINVYIFVEWLRQWNNGLKNTSPRLSSMGMFSIFSPVSYLFLTLVSLNRLTNSKGKLHEKGVW